MKENIFVKMLLFTILATAILSIYAYGQKNNQLPNKVDYNIAGFPLAEEYSLYADFDINKLPDGMFYKLNTECKYIINDKTKLLIKNYENSEMVYYAIINDYVNKLGNEDYDHYPRTDASVYIIKDKNSLYLLVDRMHSDDTRYYNLYQIINNKIELVEEESGRIDFVGYDYVIGYTDLGMIGYQECEFKKTFRNGKFELDGEYKVTRNDDSYHGYPIWKFYTLVRDLEYEEYDAKTESYVKKILKKGTKIRSLATDGKTYIEIEMEDKRKGKVRVDEVEGYNRDFIVNGQKFMYYYFLDGSKYDFEVFNSVSAY